MYNIPASTDLEMYQHRSKVVYNRLKAEGCSVPTPVLQTRDLVSHRATTQLEIEIEFYNELTDLLISCRRSKLSTLTDSRYSGC